MTDDEIDSWIAATKLLSERARDDGELRAALDRLQREAKTRGRLHAVAIESGWAAPLRQVVESRGLTFDRYCEVTDRLFADLSPLSSAQRRRLGLALQQLWRASAAASLEAGKAERQRRRVSRKVGAARWTFALVTPVLAALAVGLNASRLGPLQEGWTSALVWTAAAVTGWLTWPWVRHPLLDILRNPDKRRRLFVLAATVAAVLGALVYAKDDPDTFRLLIFAGLFAIMGGSHPATFSDRD